MNQNQNQAGKMPEPAKVLLHQITSDDLLEVLRKHSLQVANAAGRPFDAIAEELFDDLDFYRLERAALLAGDQPSAQSTAIREDIADQLVEHGVLNLPQKTLEQARAALISEWKWASDNSRDLWQSAAKTILDRILKNTPTGALILLKADLEKAGTLGVGIYYERAVKSVQVLVDMPRELPQTVENWRSTLAVGEQVFWTDPDDGICSGYRTIAEIVSDSGSIESDETIVRLTDNGSMTEALAGDISRLKAGEAIKPTVGVTASNDSPVHTDVVAEFIKRCRDNLWGECEQFPKEDWRYAVANDDTILGYWEWVYNEAAAHDVDVSSLTGKVTT
ncbi:hypothetical protein C2L64_45445 [Paraburkholderia hospita]|uniref:Uncharacterized protein n=1 Tax=Paraburkholderia hospita TaxID=169430 RepID=A0AAN1MQB7_9BURK|nr:hypothetical protein [Paraburkholderia hospita]AUT75610.1 hypothetical protein C2L64_45445 [Paraburkholderia hospita]